MNESKSRSWGCLWTNSRCESQGPRLALTDLGSWWFLGLLPFFISRPRLHLFLTDFIGRPYTEFMTLESCAECSVARRAPTSLRTSRADQTCLKRQVFDLSTFDFAFRSDSYWLAFQAGKNYAQGLEGAETKQDSSNSRGRYGVGSGKGRDYRAAGHMGMACRLHLRSGGRRISGAWARRWEVAANKGGAAAMAGGTRGSTRWRGGGVDERARRRAAEAMRTDGGGGVQIVATECGNKGRMIEADEGETKMRDMWKTRQPSYADINATPKRAGGWGNKVWTWNGAPSGGRAVCRMRQRLCRKERMSGAESPEWSRGSQMRRSREEATEGEKEPQ
ncbi:hypothetical protein C8R45DRAFT_922711 [Mycena sanguinolenta]|nr:hypothetical protein C8R45DRAFT_922711 [Mycena sanguinolenta]